MSGLLREVKLEERCAPIPTSPRRTETTRYALLADVEGSLYAAIGAGHAHLGGPGAEALTLKLAGGYEVKAEVPVAVDDHHLVLRGGAKHAAARRREVDV